MISLQGKIALVTGASRGIGNAIALGLGKAGAYVIGTATSDKGCKSISAFLKENNIDGIAKVLDISSKESITNLFAELKNSGMPDILVNNAGITKDNLLMRMSDDDWDAVVNTNLSSAFMMSKSCLRHMMKKKWEGLLIYLLWLVVWVLQDNLTMLLLSLV